MRVLKLSTVLLYISTIAFLTTLLVGSFNPGCTNVDLLDMWGQAHTRIYHNWHSVALTIIMTYLIKLHDGFQPVIVLQTLAFTCGVLLTVRKYSVPLFAVALLLGITLCPPVFYWLGFIGVDSFMACWLIFAIGCIYRYKDDNNRVFFWLGMAGLYLGFAARHNGIFAVLPLLVWLLVPRTWSRIAVLILVTVATFIGLAKITDKVFHVQTEYPEQAGFLYDMAALSVKTGTNLIPPEFQKPGVTIPMIQKQLDPYNDGWLFWGPDSVIGLTWNPAYVRHLEAAWIKAVLTHPAPYLAWRLDFFSKYAGLSPIELEPVIESCIVPNDSGFVPVESRLHLWAMERARSIEQSILFRPYLYFAILLTFLVQGVWIKRWETAWIAASGICYSLGYFVFGQTTNFRLAVFSVFVAMLLVVRLIAERVGSKIEKASTRRSSVTWQVVVSALLLVALVEVVHLARPLDAVLAGKAVVANGDFETGRLEPWEPYQKVDASVVPDRKHEGKYGLEESKDAGSVYQDVSGLVPRRTYRIVAWVSSSLGETAAAQIAAYDPVANVARFSDPVMPQPGWQRIAMTSPASASGTLRIHLFRLPGSGTVYWDDVHIYEER